MTWNNKTLVLIARYLLGVVLLVFGLNGFFNFLPMGGFPAEAGALMGALAATGYFFPMLKAFEILIGLMFIFNRAVPVATIMLVPISVSLLAFHLALAPNAVPAYLVIVLNLYFVCVNKELYKPLFTA